MEMVMLVGIPASGKSTFYKKHLFESHVRINRDMLKTKHREALLIEACLKAKQGYVIDNTNIDTKTRKDHIEKAKKHGYLINGYYFQSKIDDCLARNSLRPESNRVPGKAVLGMYNKLELPRMDEGFDKLQYVTINDQGGFSIQDWQNEV